MQENNPNITLPKPLPRDDHGNILSEFTANGNDYYIVDPEQDVGIWRKVQMDKLSMVPAFNTTFKEFVAVLKEIQSVQFSDIPADKIKQKTDIICRAAIERITDLSDAKYDKMMYYCTFFIFKKGEHFNNWTEKQANSKIADWRTEYGQNDFFILGLSRINGLYKEFKRLTSEAAHGMKQMSEQG